MNEEKSLYIVYFHLEEEKFICESLEDAFHCAEVYTLIEGFARNFTIQEF